MLRVNVLSEGYRSANSQGFLYPLICYRELIREEGIELSFYQSISTRITDCDALLIDSKFYREKWAINEELVFEEISQLSNAIESLFWFHTGDSSGSIGKFANSILPLVKLFLKNQIYRDKTLYRERIYGNRLFAQYYKDELGITDNTPVEIESLDSGSDLKKIGVSWNIAYARCYGFSGEYFAKVYRHIPIRALLNRTPRFVDVGTKRDHGIHSRMGLNFPRETISYQRKIVSDYLGRQSRTSRLAYYREMQKSRIVVSPFGWGEINNRDFEAFIFGCLLVKPSMSHLKTYPDLFVEAETLVCYRWDMSNMIELLDDVESNYSRYRDIAYEGQKRYRNAIATRTGIEKFVTRFSKLVDTGHSMKK